MEIRLLDKNFQLVEVLDIFTSFIWHRKYYECGQFELHVPKQYFDALSKAGYICMEGYEETGLVEQLGYDKDSAYIKGRFMEAALGNYVISRMQTLKGTAEQVNNKLIQSFAKTFPTADKGLPGDQTEVQAYGENLLDKCYDIAKSQEISLRLTYDYLNDQVTCYHWKGKDRTERQSQNSRVIFSADFENIVDPVYKYDESEFKNYAFVVSSKEDQADKIIIVDQSDDDEKREIWIDSGITQEDGQTMAQFEAQLRQKGREELAKYSVTESVDMTAELNNSLIYREDYDLGDLCTYVDHECGIELEQRITEITETIENNQVQVQLTFGEESKTIVQKLKRSVG